MVRKQLYLDEAQDRALKLQAKKLGVSEAEVVRQALDAALRGETVGAALKRNQELLQSFFKECDELAKTHGFREDYSFDRQKIYEEDERFARWDEKG